MTFANSGDTREPFSIVVPVDGKISVGSTYTGRPSFDRVKTGFWLKLRSIWLC